MSVVGPQAPRVGVLPLVDGRPLPPAGSRWWPGTWVRLLVCRWRLGGKVEPAERRGYWFCWDPRRNDVIPSDVQNRFSQIQPGDRIAVKRMLGRGATDMEVRAIGIVTDVGLFLHQLAHKLV